MPNQTAPSRAARSSPLRNVDNTHGHHSDTLTTNSTAPDAWESLRGLLDASVKQAGEAGRHIGQRLQAFQLINHSPLAGDVHVERIDHAVALVGEQWLNTLTFAQALAQHLRRGLTKKESEESILRVWQESIFLAEAAELLCRVTMTGSSHLGWLCGLLLGAAEIDGRLRQLHVGAEGSPRVRRRGALMVELTQLISTLEVRQELGLPSVSDKPQGPWCALSAAAELAPIESHSPWLQAVLASVQPLDWPEALSELLAKRIAELEPISCAYATRLWIHADQN